MAAFSSIVVLELWFDQDSLIYDFILDGSNEGNQCVLLSIGEISCALWIFYDAHRVRRICEHMINVVAKGRVVDEAGIVNFILVYKSINFLFAEFQVECTQASAEL